MLDVRVQQRRKHQLLLVVLIVHRHLIFQLACFIGAVAANRSTAIVLVFLAWFAASYSGSSPALGLLGAWLLGGRRQADDREVVDDALILVRSILQAFIAQVK